MNTDKFPFLTLNDKTGAAPLYRQIYESIRRAILSGEFTRGGRLPATRQLAAQLGVARMTVVNAYEQLLIEGYLAPGGAEDPDHTWFWDKHEHVDPTKEAQAQQIRGPVLSR